MTGDMSKAHIIFLNGTSSAGKGGIAAALLESLPTPYVHVGFDDFIRLTRSPAYYGEQGFQLLEENDGLGTRYTMAIGALGERFFSGMHHAVASFAAAGNNLIVDTVLWDRTWLWEYVTILRPFDVLFVGVMCPLAAVEERECKRGDRLIGLARSQFDHVHAHGMYDLTVDTSVLDARACAQRICEFIATGKVPTAFARLDDSWSANRDTP